MTKEKEGTDKVPLLKGVAAEKRILEYINEMNRPFGHADIFANLKGAIPKAAVPKILVTLAEKGEITQKAYGKTLIYVAKQTDAMSMSLEELETLATEEKKLTECINEQNALLKTCTQELNQLRNSPSDEELEAQLAGAEKRVFCLQGQLEPLRSGQPLVTAEELSHLDTELQKWKTEWFNRRKIYKLLYHLVTDTMIPQECQDMNELLGLETDTLEHNALENGPLCKPSCRPALR